MTAAARNRGYDAPEAKGEEFAPKPGGVKTLTITLPDAPAGAAASRP